MIGAAICLASRVLADRLEQVEVTMVGTVALSVTRRPFEARQRTD